MLGTVTLGKVRKDGKLAKKKIVAMLLDHSFHISTASKHALNDLDLLYKQSNTTKKSLLFFESPGQHGYHGT